MQYFCNSKEVGGKTMFGPQICNFMEVKKLSGVKIILESNCVWCSIFLDGKNNLGLKDWKVSTLKLIFSTELSEYITVKQQIIVLKKTLKVKGITSHKCKLFFLFISDR